MYFTSIQTVENTLLGNRIRGGAKLPSLREFSPSSIAQKRDTRLYYLVESIAESAANISRGCLALSMDCFNSSLSKSVSG